MDEVEVDGSFGEGGGQILRTAASFSVILGRPVRVFNIRAGRDVPGLRQQHASTMQVLGQVFGAELKGVSVGSTEVHFAPGKPSRSSVEVDMKTAASVTLLLQAVVPAAALSGSSLSLDLTGGTDVPWSPTFDYLEAVVRRGYGMLGINFTAEAEKRGYYPRGGGRVKAYVEAAQRVTAVVGAGREGEAAVDLVSRSGMLPAHVAERQLSSMARTFESAGIKVASETVADERSDSPGSSALAMSSGEGWCLGADAIGEKGVRAEDVGRKAAQRMVSNLASGAAVDANLADMLAPLLSLAPGGSELRVPEVSMHLKTGLHLAKLFTGCSYAWREEGRGFLVEIRPISGHNA